MIALAGFLAGAAWGALLFWVGAQYGRAAERRRRRAPAPPPPAPKPEWVELWRRPADVN